MNAIVEKIRSDFDLLVEQAAYVFDVSSEDILDPRRASRMASVPRKCAVAALIKIYRNNDISSKTVSDAIGINADYAYKAKQFARIPYDRDKSVCIASRFDEIVKRFFERAL